MTELHPAIAPFLVQETQLRILGESAFQQFLTRMVAHVQRYFPDEAARAGDEDALRQRVAQLIAGGQRRGLASAQDLCRYLNLILATGSEEPAWLRDVWSDPWCSTPQSRLNRALDLLQRRLGMQAHNAAARAQFDAGEMES